MVLNLSGAFFVIFVSGFDEVGRGAVPTMRLDDSVELCGLFFLVHTSFNTTSSASFFDIIENAFYLV